MTHEKIASFLDTAFDSSDLGKTTPRKYLCELLRVLWDEKEGFSGKRPFGNSGWDSDLAKALIKGGFIRGSIDQDGWVEAVDDREVDKWVRAAITHVFFSR